MAFAEVRSQIGKGGDQLMPVFLSQEDLARRGEEIEAYRSNLFKTRYLPRVSGFPAVRQLFERVRGQRPADCARLFGESRRTLELQGDCRHSRLGR